VQAARPEPDAATPVHEVITDKPIIKVPGCPPIAEVMTGVITYMLTFERLPELDRQGRPVMFYGQRIHDKCYRRPHFDAGQFVEDWDDEATRARAIACTRWAARGRPPTTPAPRCAGTTACPSRSSPATAASAAPRTASGTRAASDRVTDTQFGVEANADKVGMAAAASSAPPSAPMPPQRAANRRQSNPPTPATTAGGHNQ
jgi:hydrogenase small subunit